MKDEIKEILVRSKEQQALDDLKTLANAKEDEEVYIEYGLNTKARILLDCITNLQEENKIKDTNWESLKYYLEKLYYKDYIEEPIFDDIDKKIKELESKVEIKGYQKEIKQLQVENKFAKEYEKQYRIAKSRNEKAIEYIELGLANEEEAEELLNILKGSDKE